jgi:hypothetical protein
MGHPVKFKVKPASFIILWLMNLVGWKGWTSIWHTIYIHPDYLNNIELIRHEQVHAKQIQRDGYLWQPIKYTYYLIRYGYNNNPYEIEARKAEVHCSTSSQARDIAKHFTPETEE